MAVKLTDEIKSYILDHPEISSANLAAKFKISAQYIKTFKKNNGIIEIEDTNTFQTILQRLHNSQEWSIIEQQFSQSELEYFQSCYIDLINQFKGDVLPTEEVQIFMAIRMQILSNRNLIERKRCIDKIEDLDKQLMQAMRETPPDLEIVTLLRQDLEIIKTMETAKTNEGKTLLDNHQKLMKDLKATREQRIQRIESSKKNFLGLLKMLEEADVKEKESLEMNLVNAAVDKEKKRLSELTKYREGELDYPILSGRE